MSSIVVDGTIQVLSKAIGNFAKEDKTNLVRPSEVKIFIAISDVTIEEPSEQYPIKRVKGEPFYRVIKKGEPYMRPRKLKKHPFQAFTDEVSFLQVLGALVDFFQVEMQSKTFLMDAFNRFAENLNLDMLNDAGFKAYVKSEQDKFEKLYCTEETYLAVLKEIEDKIVKENTILPTDLEIRVATAEKQIPGKEPDYPIIPVPFLYAKGEFIKELNFAGDIFAMPE